MTIILHHYDPSPYSQKMRSMLGWKGVHWRSVKHPWLPPRPELTALTGGNRRIPVLQVGADIVCDSNLAVRVADALAPSPALAPSVLDHPMSHLWEPRMLVWMGPIRFRKREDSVAMFNESVDTAAFRADRLEFMKPAADITRSAQLAVSYGAHVVMHADWIESLLSDGRAFLAGDAPGHADFSGFHGFWWLSPGSVRAELFARQTRLWAWVERMAALATAGAPMTEAEALEAARTAEPSPAIAAALGHAPLPIDPPLGDRLRVTPDDYGQDPVEGELAAIGADHVTLRRETPEAGVVHVHFPRWGYRIDPAG